MLDKRNPAIPEEAEAMVDSYTEPLRAIDVFQLQVCVLGNHLNGKDTHMRSVRVFGPTDTDSVTETRPAKPRGYAAESAAARCADSDTDAAHLQQVLHRMRHASRRAAASALASPPSTMPR